MNDQPNEEYCEADYEADWETLGGCEMGVWTGSTEEGVEPCREPAIVRVWWQSKEKDSMLLCPLHARHVGIGYEHTDGLVLDLLAALGKITRGEGPYSRDRLTHAEGAIDAMKATAEKALSYAEATEV